MGFRFRRSIKLFPGVKINFSKSGISTSVGRPGATVNISDRGTRTTVGIPGTGLSYSETHSTHHTEPGQDPVSSQPTRKSMAPALLLVLVVLMVAVVVGITR